ncbi:hypothetical protein PRIPAC_81477 [Pristionchus pacificus]|nr:hypothetical protein PRIPAC_81477 [Pristionchus pacificus]
MMMALRISLLALAVYATPECIPRTFTDGIVCVCNSTHCDDIEPLGSIPFGNAVVYRTDDKGARMDRVIVKQKPQPDGLVIELDPSTVYQEIIGFGAAFTDSTGINIRSLPKDAQEKVMQQYFGPTGTEYTIGRVPIASTDFSLGTYSYDDMEDDLDLKFFALTHEDFDYKIPFIQQAIELQNNTTLRLFASPWSSPGWMKTNGKMQGGGELRGNADGPYYVAWATYFVKFFEAYLEQGISFWGVTPQNEPTTGSDPNYSWQTLFFDAQTESNFVKNHLGPALRSSNASKDIVIIGLDDQRFMLPGWADVMFEDAEVSSYVGGIGVHWYEDEIYPISALSHTHERHPDKFILATEASNGWLKVQGKGVRLGYFFRAERYANSIITDLNNWVAGWVDWNMALDMEGGFTWAENYVDAPIVVDGEEFYKQPMYYGLAHFSKFLKPGSHRVKADLPELPSKVFVLGAVMVNGERYVTMLNENDSEDVTISVREKGIEGVYTAVTVPSHSIVTIHLVIKEVKLKMTNGGFISWEFDMTDVPNTVLTYKSPEIEINGLKWYIGAQHESSPRTGNFYQNVSSGKLPWANFYGAWTFLTDEDNGFISNGKIIVEAKIRVVNTCGVRQLHFFYLLAVHSPVFEAMLFGNFEETNKEELEIKEVKHKEFVDFLNVIYTSIYEINDTNVESILDLADRFQFVLDAVERYLMHSSNLTTTKKLALSDTFKLNLLKFLSDQIKAMLHERTLELD